MIDYAKLAGKELMELKAYVPGKPMDEVQRESGVEKVIKLASNENPLGPSPRTFEALKNFLPEASRYPLGDSYHLRKAISEKFGVNMENVICGAGSDEIIQLLYIAFLTEGKNVVAPSPSFSEYYILAKALRAECRWVPTAADFSVDFEALLRAADENTRFVMLASPNNPTGVAFGSAALEDFLGRLPEGVIAVMDEAYIDFADKKDMPDSIALMKKFKNLVAMRTFSKAYGLASVRCGFLIGHKDCVGVLNRVRPPFNVSQAAQVMAEAALGDEEYLRKAIEANERGKRFLYDYFKKAGIEYVPSEANFVLVKTGNGKKVFEDLLKEGVIVRFLGDDRLEEYIRVSVGTEEENKFFVEKLARVLNK